MTKLVVYKTPNHFPAELWRWPNFKPAEVACRGTGQVGVNFEAMDMLQKLRDYLQKPLIINSAYRSSQHNSAVGGAKKSKHLKAKAFDISMKGHDPVLFEAAARSVGFLGFGYYPHLGFMHIDLGPARSWGDHFPPSDHPQKAPPAPEKAPPAPAKGLIRRWRRR